MSQTNRSAWTSLVRRVAKLCAEESDVSEIDRPRFGWLLALEFPAPPISGGQVLRFNVGKGGANTIFSYPAIDGKTCGKRNVWYPIEAIASLKKADSDSPLYAWEKNKEVQVSHMLEEAKKRAISGQVIYTYNTKLCSWKKAYRIIKDLNDDLIWKSTSNCEHTRKTK